MGINYWATAVFGVSYTFQELENLIDHPDCNDDLVEFWQEQGYIWSSPYYCSEPHEWRYFIGKGIPESSSSRQMKAILKKEYEIKQEIREFSQKYKLKNKEHQVAIQLSCNIN